MKKNLTIIVLTISMLACNQTNNKNFKKQDIYNAFDIISKQDDDSKFKAKGFKNKKEVLYLNEKRNIKQKNSFFSITKYIDKWSAKNKNYIINKLLEEKNQKNNKKNSWYNFNWIKSNNTKAKKTKNKSGSILKLNKKGGDIFVKANKKGPTIKEVQKKAKELKDKLESNNKNLKLNDHDLKYFQKIYADTEFCKKNLKAVTEIYIYLIQNHSRQKQRDKYILKNNLIKAYYSKINEINKNGNIFHTLEKFNNIHTMMPLGCAWKKVEKKLEEARNKYINASFESLENIYQITGNFEKINNLNFVDHVTKSPIKKPIIKLITTIKSKSNTEYESVLNTLLNKLSKLDGFKDIDCVKKHSKKTINIIQEEKQKTELQDQVNLKISHNNINEESENIELKITNNGNYSIDLSKMKLQLITPVNDDDLICEVYKSNNTLLSDWRTVNTSDTESKELINICEESKLINPNESFKIIIASECYHDTIFDIIDAKINKAEEKVLKFKLYYEDNNKSQKKSIIEVNLNTTKKEPNNIKNQLFIDGGDKEITNKLKKQKLNLQKIDFDAYNILEENKSITIENDNYKFKKEVYGKDGVIFATCFQENENENEKTKEVVIKKYTKSNLEKHLAALENKMGPKIFKVYSYKDYFIVSMEKFSPINPQVFERTSDNSKQVIINLFKKIQKFNEKIGEHTDIKPENLMANPDNENDIKLIDFDTIDKNTWCFCEKANDITALARTILDLRFRSILSNKFKGINTVNQFSIPFVRYCNNKKIYSSNECLWKIDDKEKIEKDPNNDPLKFKFFYDATQDLSSIFNDGNSGQLDLIWRLYNRYLLDHKYINDINKIKNYDVYYCDDINKLDHEATQQALNYINLWINNIPSNTDASSSDFWEKDKGFEKILMDFSNISIDKFERALFKLASGNHNFTTKKAVEFLENSLKQ